MADESFKCNVDPFPTPKYAASGGLVGNTPIICGGCCSQKSCYSLKENGSWKVESDLNTARGYTATGSVIFNNKLVIAGGIDGKNKRLATIEVVAPNTQSTTLPVRLPVGWPKQVPCIVPWDTNTLMIIGIQRKSYFINMANNTYTEGPSVLTRGRHYACHTMNINGDDYIIVSGHTTQALSKTNYKRGWQKSKN